ncbi:MAG TPA: pitrilysin family protein [Candidatus Tumulicola sp.]|nr:pitrilysin family protein [Candidatus Tumulicola sp.]
MGDDFDHAKTVLPNGIRVLSERIPHVRSASVGLWVGVGSAHEEPAARGISHCIEHMLFKGTPTRDAQQIAELMDSVGGHLNAFTDKESTCYHARVVDVHAPLTMDVLADMFLHSNFDPAELRKEQQVILEEIRMYDDSPDEVSHDLFIRSVWAGSPLGEPTIGYEQTVRAITKESIVRYKASRYSPNAVVICAAGNVDHTAFAKQIETLFGGMRGGGPPEDPAKPEFQAVTVVQPKDCEQVYLLFGAEGFSARDDRRYAVSVLDTILGSGMASRLFHEIREKRGLAYSVYSSHTPYRTAGLFTISATTGPDNAAEVVTLVRNELARIVQDGALEAEVARAKEHLKGGLLLSLESTSTRMLRLGRSELSLGRYLAISEVIERVDAVTLDDVNNLARMLFAPGRTALTVVGPVSEDFAANHALAQSA